MKTGINSMSCIQSDPFHVGGLFLAIELYPCGYNQSYSDSVSLGVRLLNPAKGANTILTIRLLDWTTSTWSTHTPWSPQVFSFSEFGKSFPLWISFSFIKRFNLDASNYLRNDTFVIKCTLWVVKDTSALLLRPPSSLPDVPTGGSSNQGNFSNAGVFCNSECFL